MDPATLIGIILAFVAMIVMLFKEGGNLGAIILPAPMILVFGATIAVAIASGVVRDLGAVVRSIPRAFVGKVPSGRKLITDLAATAERARREGLLSLEAEAATVDDPFVKAAMQNVADGMDPDELRELLEERIAAEERTERLGAKFFTTMGGYAPTIGIIGTVVSLTIVLSELSEPAELGEKIAAAFVATLWGVMSSNFLWLPIGNRLNRLADLVVEHRTLAMEGVLAIQSGAQPRVIVERLETMLGVTGEKPRKEKKPGKADAPDLKAAA